MMLRWLLLISFAPLCLVSCGGGKSLSTLNPAKGQDFTSSNGVDGTTTDLDTSQTVPSPNLSMSPQCILTAATRVVEVYTDASGALLPGQQAPIVTIGLTATIALESRPFVVEQVSFDLNRLKSEVPFPTSAQTSATTQVRPLSIGMHSFVASVYIDGNATRKAQCSIALELKGKVAPQSEVSLAANGKVGSLTLANGQNLTLSYSALNAQSCMILKNGVVITSELPSAGTLSLGIQSNPAIAPMNVTYEARCLSGTLSVSSLVYLTLNPTASLNFTFTSQAGMTTLQWSSLFMLPSCTLKEGLNVSPVPSNGSLVIPTPSYNMVYVLTCNDIANSVFQKAVEIASLAPSVTPSPSPSPVLSEIYRYLPTPGLTMAQKQQACRNLGTGWDLAFITVPQEALSMREYLVKFATPTSGTSGYSLPIIANGCKAITCMTFPNGLSPLVDCDGTSGKLLLNWPGLNDKCDPYAQKNGATTCLFQDGANEGNFPILCENNKGPYFGPPSCGF